MMQPDCTTALNIDVGNYNHKELARLLQPVAQINAQSIMDFY